MASDKSSCTETSKAKADNTENQPAPLLPPEERFWKRYSAHHEFPLSSASSALVHLLALGILALGAHSFANWATPVEVDAIVIGGGGERPGGVDGDSFGKFAQREDIKKLVDGSASQTRTPSPGETLKDAEKLKNPLVKPADEPRLTDADVALADKNLSALGQQVRDRLNAMQERAASKGVRGPGGKGGEGPGARPGKGPGAGGAITQRHKRQGRWTMIFNIRDPEDYARQLSALGAHLAVPGSSEEEYLVIEDLSRRPAVARPRNVSDINRMSWVNDNPDAVAPLFRVLQYEKIPSYFVAFFPVELERELLKKELEYRHLPEDKIEQTKFQIRRTDGGKGYEPVVISQEVKP